MDRIEEYRDLIKRYMTEYSAYKPAYGDVEVETDFNDATGHYQVLYNGWNGTRRIHSCLIHVDIRDGKIWIQHDGTKEGIAVELLAAGVPHDHIVLAFYSPERRRDTDFAVA